MSDIYPLVVVLDRYNGTYSGGKWTAWNLCYVPSKIFGDAKECADFFSKNTIVYGRGETPQEAIDDLKMILDCGISDPDEKDEDEELKAKNKDSGWKKDLEKEIKRLENKQLKENIKKLEQADMLDKEAADYWSKEHDTLSKRFAKLQEENEKLKDKVEHVEPFRSLEQTIREKHELRQQLQQLDKENKELEESNDRWMKDYRVLSRNFYELQDKLIARVLELEKLKTPTIENFADENPSTRADILDQAKKCVCGQREQDYGTPESNFQLIADLWNGYLGEKTDNPVISVTPVDVSMMMALLKIARIRNGGGSGDSFVDLAGYAACGGEIWHMQNHKDLN